MFRSETWLMTKASVTVAIAFVAFTLSVNECWSRLFRRPIECDHTRDDAFRLVPGVGRIILKNPVVV